MKNEDMTQDQQDELRDKFATAAMQALVPHSHASTREDRDETAQAAYEIADSMMAARYAVHAGIEELEQSVAFERRATDSAQKLMMQAALERDTALAANIMAERELERWRHGTTIEGDFVCPNALALANMTDARDEVYRQKEMWRKCAIGLATAHNETIRLDESGSPASWTVPGEEREE